MSRGGGTGSSHPGADETSRPYVIVSVIATADGKITLSRAERLLDDHADRRWRSAWPPDVEDLLAQRQSDIERRRQPTVFLEGSGSFVDDAAGPAAFPATDVPAEQLWEDFVPRPSPKWFAVVDGGGRVGWTYTGDEETSLLVIVSRATPLPYLAQLRRDLIPYLVAGDDRVDLGEALTRIRTRLGADCVVSEGGGALNGALLRAGLVDELHIITVPALVGGLGTPSIIDGPPLDLGSVPVQLRTIDVTVGSHGSIWSRYEVLGQPR